MSNWNEWPEKPMPELRARLLNRGPTITDQEVFEIASRFMYDSVRDVGMAQVSFMARAILEVRPPLRPIHQFHAMIQPFLMICFDIFQNQIVESEGDMKDVELLTKAFLNVIGGSVKSAITSRIKAQEKPTIN
jgi:hypothetical protein